jgi:LCP family protein required for cell wall assembly
MPLVSSLVVDPLFWLGVGLAAAAVLVGRSDAGRIAPRLRTTPPWAGLASAIWPGLGHVLRGRRVGWAIMAFWVVIIAAVLSIATRRPTWSIASMLDPTLMVVFGAISLVILAFRTWVVIDSRSIRLDGEPETRKRAGRVAIGVATLAVIVVPHALFLSYSFIQFRLVNSLFVQADSEEAAPQRRWDGNGRFNLLVLGADSGPGRSGMRTDTIMVLSVDPVSSNVAILSIPRNLACVPFPSHLVGSVGDCFPDIVNALWAHGEARPEQFGGEGPAGLRALRPAVEELLGIPIHNYALVDLNGFVAIVDAIGGVTVDVERPVRDDNYRDEQDAPMWVDIPEGTVNLDGRQALAYVRSRRTSDDYDRTGRQRRFLRALASQALGPQIILTYPSIASAISDNLVTDIPLETIQMLAWSWAGAAPASILEICFGPPKWTAELTPEGKNTPDRGAIKAAVQAIVTLPPDRAASVVGLESGSSSCHF